MELDFLEDLLCSKIGFIRQQLYIIGVEESDRDYLEGDILEEAYKSLHSMEDPEKIEGWLKTIIIRRVSKLVKKKPKRREVSNIMKLETGETVDVYELYSDQKSAEEIFIEAEKRHVARELLETLPEKKKRIIQMRFWGDYTFKEIAAMTNTHESTVKSAFSRSIKQLGETFDKKYGKEERYDR